MIHNTHVSGLEIEDSRLVSISRCKQIHETLKGFSSGEGGVRLTLTSSWNSSLRWSRNFVNLGTDKRMLWLDVVRETDSSVHGWARTNQIDDISLEGVVKAAERKMRRLLSHPRMPSVAPEQEYADSQIWADDTFNATIDDRGRIAKLISSRAKENGLSAAGFIEVHASEIVRIDVNDVVSSVLMTQAQCSMTVRDPKNYGSGWAGLSSYSWGAIDAESIANTAFDKCIASMSPVRIEPGRYTVIMEPQAVADCIEVLLQSFSRKDPEDRARGPFFLGRDNSLGLYRSKLGLQVIDSRITISHDPMDPRLGILDSAPEKRVWIEDGFLVSLDLFRPDVLRRQTVESVDEQRRGFHVSGGDSSMDEMISSTSRGLLMTRFHDMTTLNPTNLLSTGVTRDGLWLIENGSITKAVNNLRCTDSPLFMLNQVDQLGIPVPVFNPVHSSFSYLTPRVVPPIKSRDYSFTSLVDAV